MTAVIYARFSPRRNADECMSNVTQIEHCRTLCVRNGWRVTGVHSDEGLSGADKKRPGLAAALDQVCRSKEATLVVYSLSRLARSTRDCIDFAERLAKAKANLVCVRDAVDTTTATGRMFFRILAVLAEFERELVVERTSEAMLAHQARGRRMSDAPPYGTKAVGSRLIEDAAEQEAVELIRKLRAGGMGLRPIAHELTRRGIPCRGKRWRHGTIKRILDRV